VVVATAQAVDDAAEGGQQAAQPDGASHHDADDGPNAQQHIVDLLLHEVQHRLI
jgi:hypothetical protein